MHFRAITRIVGLLVILFSGTMIIHGLVALIYRDGAGRAFTQTFFVALAIGSMLWWPNRKEKGELKSREGFLIVVLFWTVLGSVGALPLSSRKARTSRLPMRFESFSGLTTTGPLRWWGWIRSLMPSSFIARCCNGLAVWGSSCWRLRYCLSSAWVGCSSIAQKCPAR
ncbi:hypothetical protein DMH20_20295 [Escherichia coli]|nr:hypothetical protein [Escherichia coli]